jgi:putative endonuclease
MHLENYYCYIMASRSRIIYVGITSDLHGRVFKHKWKEYGGFTARYNCDRLVWFEAFHDVGDAILREKELKGWRREKKLALINAMNQAWVDLARDWCEAEPVDFVR